MSCLSDTQAHHRLPSPMDLDIRQSVVWQCGVICGKGKERMDNCFHHPSRTCTAVLSRESITALLTALPSNANQYDANKALEIFVCLLYDILYQKLQCCFNNNKKKTSNIFFIIISKEGHSIYSIGQNVSNYNTKQNYLNYTIILSIGDHLIALP